MNLEAMAELGLTKVVLSLALLSEIGILWLALIWRLNPAATRLMIARWIKTYAIHNGIPIKLSGPILALRAPADEASLAIASTQVVEMVVNKLFHWVVVTGQWSYDLLRKKGFLGMLCIFLPIYVGLFFSLFFLSPDSFSFSDEADIIRGAFISAITIALFPLPILLAFLGVYVLMIPAICLMGLATGFNPLFRFGAVTVEAEPLPFAEPSEWMRFEIVHPTESELMHLDLMHSLHEIPSVRHRVGSWIIDLQDTKVSGE